MKTAEELRAEFDRGENIRTFKPRAERQGGNGKANGTASYRDFAISAVDLESKHFDPVEYVVAGILPVGLAVLSAAPKVGKTWMDMGMSDDIAAGRVFGGTKVTAKGAVLLLDLEGNRRRAQRRLRHLRQGAEPP